MARTGTRVELSNELLEQLDRYRERDGRSRSAVIRAAIEQYLADERKAEIDRLILDGYRRMPQQDVGERKRHDGSSRRSRGSRGEIWWADQPDATGVQSASSRARPSPRCS